MKTVKGDLLLMAYQAKFDVIVHGCNCFHTMAGGIAKQIRKTWPSAYSADTSTMYGDRNKMGQYSATEVKNKWGNILTIVNGYTQFEPNPPVDYTAIQSVFEGVAQQYDGARIAYPGIGAGLAGGDWNIIKGLIAKALNGQDHTYVEFDPYWAEHKDVHYRHALKVAYEALHICQHGMPEVEVETPVSWNLKNQNKMVETSDILSAIEGVLWKYGWH